MNMALDSAIATRNNKDVLGSPVRDAGIGKPPFSGHSNTSHKKAVYQNKGPLHMSNYSQRGPETAMSGTETLMMDPSPSQTIQMPDNKQADINRRLNDLLNRKDDEILNLNQKIIELQLNQNSTIKKRPNPARSSS
jgi:hypothetical protein